MRFKSNALKQRETGFLPRYGRPVWHRFWTKVEFRPDGCWEWTGSRKSRDYGTFKVEGRTVNAHRWAYEYFLGAIPDALVADHLCRNHWCVNPSHVEPVTQKKNIRRGLLGTPLTHCRRAGHPYTPENTRIYVYGSVERRFCRACGVDHQNIRRARRGTAA